MMTTMEQEAEFISAEEIEQEDDMLSDENGAYESPIPTGDFITKDSGVRQQFASGMVRDTQDGKLRYDLAFDGPLFWALYPDMPLVQAAKRWYETGGLQNAATVVRALGMLEGGLFKVIDRYAALMMRGAIKYTEKNWMKAEGAEEFCRFRASFCRHLKQYINHETDEDHMAAVFFNLNGAEYVKGRLDSVKTPADTDKLAF